MGKRVAVTGAAGFIGSNLVDMLLGKGFQVIGIDNISTGRVDFLKQAMKSKGFSLITEDILKYELAEIFKRCDCVFHLAANADVRRGPEHPGKDLEQNALGTFRILEAMRLSGCENIVFASTGSIYGESTVVPTPEDAPFPVQTSLYGASKLAAEGLVSAYCNAYGMNGVALRFVSVLGKRYTHGHIFDFCKQLKADSTQLKVLGNGFQLKSYFNVVDCVKAVTLFGELMMSGCIKGFEAINLGREEAITVRESIAIITDTLGVQPVISYGSSSRGWIGDNPIIELRIEKAKTYGWLAEKSIEESVRETTMWVSDFIGAE